MRIHNLDKEKNEIYGGVWVKAEEILKRLHEINQSGDITDINLGELHKLIEELEIALHE